ncbi:MAG: tetratricopeptide repeat protein [Candidatus Zixiibacteriota bacterium]|nr:MAG: tetratricopeptide repeat protein [candidate division Zixibacteria bacterium]
MVDTVVLKDSIVIGYFVDKMVLAKFNAKVDTVLAKDYAVSAFPTLVLTDKDGKEIDRIIGYLKPDEFLQKLEDYQNGIGTLEDLLARADTLEDRDMYFEIAEKYKYSGRPDEATEWFDKVIGMGEPTDSLSGESRMALADMIRRAKDYDGAREAFLKIMKDFDGTPVAEEAEIWRAYIYVLGYDTANAITAFKEFIRHYPESEESEWAQKQIDKLEGKAPEAK